MKLPVTSISGIRGVIGESIIPELVVNFAGAFATLTNCANIVVGTDTRPSREMMKYAVLSGLVAGGCNVTDVGICPTPSVQLMVEKLSAGGGIVLTASHNPVEWNALKFFNAQGTLLCQNEYKRLLQIYSERSIRWVPWDKLGQVKYNNKAIATHIETVLNRLDISAIRRCNFRVALDCCNGTGAVITPSFLTELGCEVINLNCQPDGYFAHPPEPIPAHLADLCQLVKDQKVDIGFAQDPDADRLALVDESGICIGEEYTLALVTRYVLSLNKGPVVTNLSTTRVIDEVASQFNCPVYRSPVGEINVVEQMKAVKAIIGGEGNGGVIDPRVHYCRDSLVGIGLILQYMAHCKRKISDLVSEFPRYFMIKAKERYSREDIEALMGKVEDRFTGGEVDKRDGIRISWDDCWLHIRPSGTEPVVRVIAEAKEEQKAKALCDTALELMKKE